MGSIAAVRETAPVTALDSTDLSSQVSDASTLAAAARRALQGNLHKEGEKLAKQGKLFVRERIDLLLDPGSFIEDSLLANASAADLPADGVVVGTGTIDGRTVAVMANGAARKTTFPF